MYMQIINWELSGLSNARIEILLCTNAHGTTNGNGGLLPAIKLCHIMKFMTSTANRTCKKRSYLALSYC